MQTLGMPMPYTQLAKKIYKCQCQLTRVPPQFTNRQVMMTVEPNGLGQHIF